MSISKKENKKVLRNKLTQLNDVVADIDQVLAQMDTEFFRVAIFGSARLKQDTEAFEQVYQLAYQLALLGIDVVTGGGPGLMEAANKGAKEVGKKSRSIGLSIILPFEAGANEHLDIKREHRRFSTRLDDFMRTAHAVIVTEGGIGTLLELFYTWQLIQAEHMKPRPILLLGQNTMWVDLMDWMKKWPLQRGLMSASDFDHITLCSSIEDVIANLEPTRKEFYAHKHKNA
jgi:uncharacterized protein (TIGR00730 family)